jgi:transposase-like protein
MSRRERDAEKARYWQRIIREAARSGTSIREFCRQRRLKESQFYWWQHKLKAGRRGRTTPGQGVTRGAASFALVSDEPEATDAGIELVLGDGRRLRIRKGVDEETLRAVLAAVGPLGAKREIPDYVVAARFTVLDQRSLCRSQLPFP